MTKETAFQTLGVSEDASPQQIKQAWRDMLAVWHPDKHMGNERLRRKAEEQAKRINEAYDRIQTGNFKSSSHGSYQGEWVRTVYVEKEKPVYIKKSSGFSKAFAGLTATGMVVSMTMCANRDEYNRQNSADFQYTISKLEAENSRFQHLLDQNVATRTNIVYPKLQRVIQATQAISEWIHHEYDPPKYSKNTINLMDGILDAFKSASGEDEKQSVLVAARIAITSIVSREWASDNHPRYFEYIYSYNEAQLKQWVSMNKRYHENYLKTLEEARRKEADAAEPSEAPAALTSHPTPQQFGPSRGPIRTKEQLEAALTRLRGEAKQASALLPKPNPKHWVGGRAPIRTKEQIEADLALLREERRLREEFAANQQLAAQQRQAAAVEQAELQQAAAAEQARRAEAQQQAQESNGNQAMKENCPEAPFRGEQKVR